MPGSDRTSPQAAPAAESAQLSIGGLAAAHARFARAVFLLSLGAAAVALALIVGLVLQDRAHEEARIRSQLALDNEIHAAYLARHLGQLQRELQRLGLRAEFNLQDADPSPERSLLSVAHERSTVFNVGVAIISAAGAVDWSEPRGVLDDGAEPRGQAWFHQLQHGQTPAIVAPAAVSGGSRLWIVSPVTHDGVFAGALVGVIDLAREEGTGLAGHSASDVTRVVVAERSGRLVYPREGLPGAESPGWSALVARASRERVREALTLGGTLCEVVGTPLSDTPLVLLSAADTRALYGPAAARMWSRLGLALVLTAVPLILLRWLFARSMATFRAAEAEAVRADRMRLLGEASNAIAHEIKNSLNSLRLGFDLLLRRSGAEGQEGKVIGELRRQIERMSDFTSELLLFSKGVAPRTVALDLPEFVEKVTALARASASELGVELDIERPGAPIAAHADPALVHVVLTNLVGNALEAVTGRGAPEVPRVTVRTACSGRMAEVRVADNGPGVAAEIKPQLFEPFVSGKPSGVGIGLALSRKIARAHGGDLMLEPTARGASFVLTLPMESR